MKYKAVLFDLDGTLVDTLDDLTDAMNYALCELGQPVVSREQCREMIGKGLSVFAEKALPEGAKHLQEMLIAGMKARYIKTCLDKTYVYAGLQDVLEKWKKEGLLLGVVSNKEHTLTTKIVEHYFGKRMFSFVLGQKEGIKLKPDPEPIVYASKQLGLVNLNQLLFVGDSDVDVQTAQNAKIAFIGVSWGFRSANQLCQAGAKWIIDKPEALLAI